MGWPLDKDVGRAREGLRGSFLLMAGLSVTFLLLFGAVLFVGKRRSFSAPGGRRPSD